MKTSGSVNVYSRNNVTGVVPRHIRAKLIMDAYFSRVIQNMLGDAGVDVGVMAASGEEPVAIGINVMKFRITEATKFLSQLIDSHFHSEGPVP
jgi:hypothetical protein